LITRGWICRFAVSDEPLILAVTTTVSSAFTILVEKVNPAEMPPEAIWTAPGMVALMSLEERMTVKPPAGAGAFRYTPPWAEAPPIRVEGVSVKLARARGLMVSVAVFDDPFKVAVIVAVVEDVTGAVTISKIVEVELTPTTAVG